MPNLWYVDDLEPSVSDVVLDDNGDPVDLTVHDVTFKMRLIGAADTEELKVEQPPSNVLDATGIVRYDWQDGDLDTPGFYLAWWEYSVGGGRIRVLRRQETLIEVRTHGSVAIIELAEVRQRLELRATDTDLDAQIVALIPVAAREIARFARREFTPTDGATRRFRVSGPVVELDPYDIREVTSVTLDPDGAATVIEAGDYRMQPSPKTDNVWTDLHLSSAVRLDFERFGWTEVEIEGDWGFETVPTDVRDAAVVAIRSWLRRDVSTYAQIAGDDPRSLPPDAYGTYKLPPASKAKLDGYRRLAV